MADVEVICSCGQRIRMSEYAVGMPRLCPACSLPLDYTRVEAMAERAPAQAGVEQVRDTRAQDNPVLERRPGAPPPQEASAAGRTHCARCGRRFRGDWDVHETPSGPLCNICANRAGETPAPLQTQQTPGRVAPAPPLEPIEVYPAPDEHGPAPKRFEFNPASPQFQLYLKLAAVGVIAITVYFAITESGKAPEPAVVEPAAVPAEEPQLSVAGLWIAKGVRFVLGVAALAAQIYLTLALDKKLPSNTVIGSALHIGAFAAGLMVFQMLVGWIFCVGPILFLLVLLYVLIEVYNFGIAQFITWFLVGLVLWPLTYGVEVMVFGLLARPLL